MKVGNYTTLRLSTKDQRLMAELMAFWNRTDKGILKLAFDQLVLATQQVQQRLMDEESKDESIDDSSDDASSSTGHYEDYGNFSCGVGNDGSEVAESVADGALPDDGPADGSNEAEEQSGAE